MWDWCLAIQEFASASPRTTERRTRFVVRGRSDSLNSAPGPGISQVVKGEQSQIDEPRRQASITIPSAVRNRWGQGI
eukprot:12509186-Alexandrium_andersonii.AAC.1